MKATQNLILIFLVNISCINLYAQCTNYSGDLDTDPVYICGVDTFFVEVQNQVIDVNSYVVYSLYEMPNTSSTLIDSNQDGYFVNDGSYTNIVNYLNVSIIDPVNGCDTISEFQTVFFLNPIEFVILSDTCNYSFCELEITFTIIGGAPEVNGFGNYYLSTDFFTGSVAYGEEITLGPLVDASTISFTAVDSYNCQAAQLLILQDSICNQSAPSDSIFINEIHYKNSGADINEGVEIVGPAGYNVSSYRLYLIDGITGLAYDTIPLSGIIPDQDAGFGTLWFPVDSMINSVGGVALYGKCGHQLIQFLSYEGMFYGNWEAPYNPNYPQSEDILVDENSALVGESLQLIGSGQNYANFVWSGPLSASAGQINKTSSSSPGQMNSYQYFGSDPGAIFYSNQENIEVIEQDTSINLEISVTNLNEIESAELIADLSSTAIVNEDYSLTSSSLSFDDLSNPNQTLEITLNILDDGDAEADESIILELNSSNITVPKTIEITILNDDVLSNNEIDWAEHFSIFQSKEQIICSSNKTIEELSLLNLNGQLEVKSDSPSLDISYLPKGLYVLIVKIDGVTSSDNILID